MYKFMFVALLSALSLFGQMEEDEKKSREVNPAYQSIMGWSAAPAHIQIQAGEANLKVGRRTAVGQTPIIYNGGIVNTFYPTFVNAVAPGEFVSIYGANFANFGQSAPAGNLPTFLNGVQVLVNNVAASLSYVGPNQINAQLPYSTLSFGNNTVVVSVNGLRSANFMIGGSIVLPALYKLGSSVYTQNQAGQPVGMPGYQGLLIGSTAVASIHYASGLGLTSPFVAAGQVTYTASSCNSSMIVQYSSTPVTIGYCGLSPGSIGLGQVNLIWPASTPAGTHTIRLRHGGVDIPAFTVTTRR